MVPRSRPSSKAVKAITARLSLPMKLPLLRHMSIARAEPRRRAPVPAAAAHRAHLTVQAIFSDNCSVCHTVGTTSTSYSELAGDGSKVTTKFEGGKSHNGKTLTADEIAAVATYVDSQGGTTTPDTGTDGGSTPSTPDGPGNFF